MKLRLLLEQYGQVSKHIDYSGLTLIHLWKWLTAGWAEPIFSKSRKSSHRDQSRRQYSHKIWYWWRKQSFLMRFHKGLYTHCMWTRRLDTVGKHQEGNERDRGNFAGTRKTYGEVFVEHLQSKAEIYESAKLTNTFADCGNGRQHWFCSASLNN